MQSKVSIIIPIYNVEKYLRECLDSVVNQTLKDIEIICVNDGSPDNCGAIIDEYAKNDPRIKVIHKQNGGYGSAMNVGLENATGEYIGIVEPDDFIELNMYENLYDLAKLHNAEIVKSCFYDNLDTKNFKSIKKMKWGKDYELPNEVFTSKKCPLFLYFHPSIWSCIYEREFIDKNDIRFIEAKGAGWTDNPFQVQTTCLAKRIFYTDEAYYYWRKLNTNESKDLKDYAIPFNRSNEIHAWLEKNNINDENILACLYKRELIYMHIVLGMLKIKDFKAASELIKSMLKRMDEKIINQNSLITKKEKTALKNLKSHLGQTLAGEKIKRMRKELICIKWNKREKSVMLLGKILLPQNIAEGGIK